MKAFLRPGSIQIRRSIEGYGTPPSVHDYPHQGVDVRTDTWQPVWLGIAKIAAVDSHIAGTPVKDRYRSGELKHRNARTPLGTPVAVLAREGGDMLSSKCGDCQAPLSGCSCAFAGASE